MIRSIYIAIVISIVGSLSCRSLFGQQAPNYNQYMMNSFLINPAAAGADGYTAFNFTSRRQWLGLADAPFTNAFSVQSRVLKNSFISRRSSVRRKRSFGSRSGNVGYGAYIFTDQNGVLNRTGVQGTYSYHIRSGQTQYSGGFSILAYQYKVNLDKVILNPRGSAGDLGGDRFFQENRANTFNFDANLGIYALNPVFYAGLSVSELFPTAIQLGDVDENSFRIERTYNLLGGYKYKPDRYLLVEPSFLLKYPEGQNPQLDINTKLTYRGEYWGGLSYRTGNAIIIFLGVKFDKYYFGYAFEYTLQSISRYTFGSHEFMIAVKFGENARRYRWLNRY